MVDGGAPTVPLFVGGWLVTSGQATINCPGMAPSSQSTAGDSVRIAAGPAAGEISYESWADAGSCPEVFRVAGSTASALPGQSCTVTGSGYVETVSFESDMLTTSDGKTMSQSGNYQISLSGGGVPPMTCTATLAQKLARM